jgi:hypothetical protein
MGLLQFVCLSFSVGLVLVLVFGFMYKSFEKTVVELVRYSDFITLLY